MGIYIYKGARKLKNKNFDTVEKQYLTSTAVA